MFLVVAFLLLILRMRARVLFKAASTSARYVDSDGEMFCFRVERGRGSARAS